MLISLTEYAAKNGKSESAARRMALRGSFQTARKIGRNWVIEDTEIWPDHRIRSGKYMKKQEEKAMIECGLSNGSCLFDSGRFDTVQEALEWAMGRGGEYVIQIAREGEMGISIGVDGEKLKYYDGFGWEEISQEDVEKMI